MIVNGDNIKELPIDDQGKCRALLADIDEMNRMAPSIGFYIFYNDDEDDVFYGSYRLKAEKIGQTESLGTEMSIEELDYAICVASDMVEHLLCEIKEEDK